MNARWWRWLRPIAGALILVALGMQLGAGPFLDGLGRVRIPAVLAAVAITALTTWCSAARWRLLAARFEVALPAGEAFGRYYQSQFLNAILPGGVVGDVHRAVRHGRDSGALGNGVRSVVWDRVSGQLTLAALALIAFWMPPGAAVALITLTALTAALLASEPGSRLVLGVVGWSVAAAAGHVTVFLIAVRAVGVDRSYADLVPLALMVLIAAAIPLNVAGWGPREGAAAWLFGAAGLGADVGLQVSVVFGVLSMLATLPGALVLAAGAYRVRPAAPETVHG